MDLKKKKKKSSFCTDSVLKGNKTKWELCLGRHLACMHFEEGF